MSSPIAGPSAEALASLSPSQIQFLQKLPKAELHAHLNGSIPINTLRQLAEKHLSDPTASTPEAIKTIVERLQSGVELNEIHEFFGLFPAIYALTSTPENLKVAAKAVLEHFLEDVDGSGYPQASYLELRSTPRETPAMSRLQYIEAVLDEVEKYSPEQAALIVSLDRRMSDEVARECVDCAVKLKNAGRRVVGVDLCGDPLAGNMDTFTKHFAAAKSAGLGITLHIAETLENHLADTQKLLSFNPDRVGHATFLGDEEKNFVQNSKIGVEICLSSNLLCKTVANLSDHHIRYYLKYGHPIVICTDDILPFRNSLLGEYALLMAAEPLGLGLREDEIERIAKMGMECRFKSS